MQERICTCIDRQHFPELAVYLECMYHGPLFVSYVGYLLFEYYLMLEHPVAHCFWFEARCLGSTMFWKLV